MSHSSRRRSPVRQLRSLLRHPQHCGDIARTYGVLCKRAQRCSCHCAAYSLYSLRTFSTAEPSIGMGATLGHGPSLDWNKTPACRTLGALPCHTWRTVPSTATATTPTGAIRTPARSPQDQGCRPGQLPHPAPYPPVHHSVLSTVQIHCAPPIRGEDDDFCGLPVHVLRPSLSL